jgi:hypothetical protein
MIVPLGLTLSVVSVISLRGLNVAKVLYETTSSPETTEIARCQTAWRHLSVLFVNPCQVMDYSVI